MLIGESDSKAKSIFRRLVDRFSDAMARQREIMQLDTREIDAVARDLNLSSADFQALSFRPPGLPESLTMRLCDVGVSENELAVAHSDVLRDMERVCSQCRFKSRCARDLAHGRRATPAKYCPNE